MTKEIHGRSILIIGEQCIIVKAIANLCESLGITCIHKKNGANALKPLYTIKFDLIFTSIFNEDVDGVQIISSVKVSVNQEFLFGNLKLEKICGS